tara:strand:+ start:145 stop:666 length:522 start_codon:yes stop_codon:yes gene_type:complete
MLDRDNLNYEILLNNEYNEVYTDDMISDMLEKRKRGLEDDSRPQIGEDYDRKVNDVLVNKEQEKIIQEYERSERHEESQRKTIMDMPLKDIFQKTSETTDNFMEDYNLKLIEAKYNYENKYGKFKDNISWTDFITIHGLAFVEYMKEGDHTLYIGILLVFISVIIYIFNISGI